MGSVILNDIRIYAFHGCMEEEARIGSDYIVNLEVETNMEEASRSDDLDDAVDYVKLLYIVKNEMLIRSKLLEHVVQRIVHQIMKDFAKEKKEIKVVYVRLKYVVKASQHGLSLSLYIYMCMYVYKKETSRVVETKRPKINGTRPRRMLSACTILFSWSF